MAVKLALVISVLPSLSAFHQSTIGLYHSNPSKSIPSIGLFIANGYGLWRPIGIFRSEWVHAKELGEAIKKARELKGLSQKELALACKMDQAHYSRIENGKTDLSFSAVVRIAKAMGLELYELFKTNTGFKEVSSLDKSVM